jgi:hypothetical protein
MTEKSKHTGRPKSGKSIDGTVRWQLSSNNVQLGSVRNIFEDADPLMVSWVMLQCRRSGYPYVSGYLREVAQREYETWKTTALTKEAARRAAIMAMPE